MNKYNYTGPSEFEPLSPWAYFGYTVLFSIPIVGFIFLIIFSIKAGNINRRNFARSYWCAYILAGIIIAIMFALGMGGTLISNFNNAAQNMFLM
jgi:hypothetical protein